MSGNSTCEFEYQIRERTLTFRWYCLVFSIVVLTIVLSTWIFWYKNRDTAHLRHRNGTLMGLCSIGVVFTLLNGSIWRYDKNVFNNNCVGDNFFYFICFPSLFWPLVVRLIVWSNRIRLNYVVAGEVATQGLSRVDVGSIEMQRRLYRASRKYGLTLVAIVLLPYDIGVFLLLQFYICA